MGYSGPRAGGEYVGRTANDGRPVPTYTGGYGAAPGAVNLYPPTYESCVAQLGLTPSGLYLFDEASGALVDKTYAASLTKTGASNAYDGGASSTETMAADGYVEITLGPASYSTYSGLVTSYTGHAHSDTGHAWWTSLGSPPFVAEAGSTKWTDTGNNSVAGDVYRIERVGTTVYFYRNGVLKYTSLTALTGTVLLNTSAYWATLSSSTIYRFAPGRVVVPITWANVGSHTANGAENNLTAAGAPTYGDVYQGRRGIDYPLSSARHTASVHPIAAAESCIVAAVADFTNFVATNGSTVWGWFTGPNYAMIYGQADDISIRAVSGATVSVAVAKPAAGRSFVGAQIDRSGPTVRILHARAGTAVKGNAGATGLGAIAEVFGPQAYNSSRGIHTDLGLVFRGAQCEGATALDTMAVRLGFL